MHGADATAWAGAAITIAVALALIALAWWRYADPDRADRISAHPANRFTHLIVTSALLLMSYALRGNMEGFTIYGIAVLGGLLLITLASLIWQSVKRSTAAAP